jgi:hypothetical protein
VVTVEAAAVKRLRAKEEIQRMGHLNSALEEQVKNLYVEAQVWRDLGTWRSPTRPRPTRSAASCSRRARRRRWRWHRQR